MTLSSSAGRVVGVADCEGGWLAWREAGVGTMGVWCRLFGGWRGGCGVSYGKRTCTVGHLSWVEGRGSSIVLGSLCLEM